MREQQNSLIIIIAATFCSADKKEVIEFYIFRLEPNENDMAINEYQNQNHKSTYNNIA